MALGESSLLRLKVFKRQESGRVQSSMADTGLTVERFDEDWDLVNGFDASRCVGMRHEAPGWSLAELIWAQRFFAVAGVGVLSPPEAMMWTPSFRCSVRQRCTIACRSIS